MTVPACPHLVVVDPGLHVTLQDAGRPSAQHWGVPRSGALDRDGLRLCNWLAGNAPTEAALELLHSGMTVEVRGRSMRVALAGHGGHIEIDGDRQLTVGAWRAVDVHDGERIRVVPGVHATAYLAVGGGFDTEPVFASRSTCTRLGLGGWRGGRLVAGGELPVRRHAQPVGPALALAVAPSLPTGPIEVIRGPQIDRFDPDDADLITSVELRVSRDSDRMGMRLRGATIHWRDDREMLSDGVVPGAVQIPAHGDPVVLLADCQTTGGYPKVAVVCTVDLPRVGRLRPGDGVRFAWTNAAAARDRLRRHELAIRSLIDRARPAAALPDVHALHRTNLIGGAVDLSTAAP